MKSVFYFLNLAQHYLSVMADVNILSIQVLYHFPQRIKLVPWGGVRVPSAFAYITFMSYFQ